jgi:hypothetical protein
MSRLAAGVVDLRIACIVSHQGAGAQWAATKPVHTVWTRCGTNVFLGRQDRQGARLKSGDAA